MIGSMSRCRRTQGHQNQCKAWSAVRRLPQRQTLALSPISRRDSACRGGGLRPTLDFAAGFYRRSDEASRMLRRVLMNEILGDSTFTSPLRGGCTKSAALPTRTTRVTRGRHGGRNAHLMRNLVKKLAQTGPSVAELEGTRMKRPNPQRDGPRRKNPCLAEIGQGPGAKATQP